MKLKSIATYLMTGIKIMVIGLIGAVVMFPLTAAIRLGLLVNRPILTGVLGLVSLLMVPVGLVISGWLAGKLWSWK